jgi:hypothetical protein
MDVAAAILCVASLGLAPPLLIGASSTVVAITRSVLGKTQGLAIVSEDEKPQVEYVS